MLVHVVDAASEDPVADYRTVKEVCVTSFNHFFFIILFATVSPESFSSLRDLSWTLV